MTEQIVTHQFTPFEKDLGGWLNIDFEDMSRYVNDSALGMRNRVINGDMRIDQRFAGAAIAAAANGAYTLDRWTIERAGALVCTVEQVEDAPSTTGLYQSMKCTVTTADAALAAGDYFTISQKVEGYTVSDFAFGTAAAFTCTLSFYVKSSVAGIYSGSLRNSAANRSYPFHYAIDTANTWEKKSVVITGDTGGAWLRTTGIGVTLFFTLFVGSTFTGTGNTWAAANYLGTSDQNTTWAATTTNTFNLTGVQLEKGSIPSPFQIRSLDQELRLCQRYFWKTFNHDVAIAQNTGSSAGLLFHRVQVGGALLNYAEKIVFPVTMRTAPTITFYNPNAANALARNVSAGTDSGAVTAQAAGHSGFAADYGQAAGDAAAHGIVVHASADAEL